MDKKIEFFATAFFVFLFLGGALGAESQNGQTYWHNSDYYSVQMNGLGNAFVSAEINLQSISESPVYTITLRIPYSDALIYRVMSANGSSGYPYYGGNYPSYYNSNLQFANYTTVQGSNYTLITILLNSPLVNSTQTTLYIFFSARNASQKTFQGYQFNFSTIVDPNALIKSAYAGVEVPQNMYLKGEPSFNINYQNEALQQNIMGAASPAQIGTYLPDIFRGSYQYQASNLLPGEVFTISGLYGNNIFLLYLPEIIFGMVVLVLVAYTLKHSLLPRLRFNFSLKTKKGFSLARALLAGAFSGFLFQIAYYAMLALSGLFGYYYNAPFEILLLLLSFVVLMVSLFGLPIYLYIKFDKKEGIVAGVLAIFAGLVYSVIIAYLLYAPVYPMAV